MEDKDLLRLKIDIRCSNLLAYQDIAYLVDKPEFLLRLTKLREKYQIHSFIALDNYKDWWIAKIKDDLRIYGTEKKMLLVAEKLFGRGAKKPSDSELFDSLPYSQRFDWDTKLLTRTFNRPSYFHPIIKQAIVCGAVDESSWKPTYATVLPPELPVYDSDLPEVVIVVSPMSRITDVERVFKEEVSKIFKNDKWKFKYQTAVKKDSTKNILRDRDWYWLKLEGNEPGDIYDKYFIDPERPTPTKLKDMEIDSIAKAVGRYIENLQDRV